MTRLTRPTIDLFAGPGGWDEGIAPLGIRPAGIDYNPVACRTGRAAGHQRFCADIASLDPRAFAARHAAGKLDGLIGSPPCQGFSITGDGRGRDDSELLLEALSSVRTRGDLEGSLAVLHARMTDDGSLLALEPLRWALALSPRWMAWEQVPAVLPLWKACAAVLREHGYSVTTGMLQSEQYGVPQTRKRAILTARRDGTARLPEPTHSRYHSRDPLRMDAGVKPWVSIAEGLGWPASAVGQRIQRSNYSSPSKYVGQTAAERGLGSRPLDAPSFSITSKVWHWVELEGDGTWGRAVRATVPEASAIQSFRADYPWCGAAGAGGEQWQQVGDAVPPLLARAVVAAAAF